jgi:hypothetical protein
MEGRDLEMLILLPRCNARPRPVDGVGMRLFESGDDRLERFDVVDRLFQRIGERLQAFGQVLLQ